MTLQPNIGVGLYQFFGQSLVPYGLLHEYAANWLAGFADQWDWTQINNPGGVITVVPSTQFNLAPQESPAVTPQLEKVTLDTTSPTQGVSTDPLGAPDGIIGVTLEARFRNKLAQLIAIKSQTPR